MLPPVKCKKKHEKLPCSTIPRIRVFCVNYILLKTTKIDKFVTKQNRYNMYLVEDNPRGVVRNQVLPEKYEIFKITQASTNNYHLGTKTDIWTIKAALDVIITALFVHSCKILL